MAPIVREHAIGTLGKNGELIPWSMANQALGPITGRRRRCIRTTSELAFARTPPTRYVRGLSSAAPRPGLGIS